MVNDDYGGGGGNNGVTIIRTQHVNVQYDDGAFSHIPFRPPPPTTRTT